MLRLFRFLPRRWWSLHDWKIWKSYIHWRLETFGAYYPEGKLTRTSLAQLLRQFPSYYRWLKEMEQKRLG